jgi:hypothetical protein
VNLSPARLAVIVALVVGGVAVLLNGFEGSTGAAAADTSSPSPAATTPPASTTAAPTDPPTETPTPQTEGVAFMVFNGTSELGLAGTVQQNLEAEGYIAAEKAANAITSPVSKTTVYFRGGDDAAQNESDATYMAEELLGDAAVKLLGVDYEDAVPPDTQLVIIVGTDYAGPGATA